VFSIAASGAGFTFLSVSPFAHWHPCLSEPRGVAADHTPLRPLPLTFERMLRYSFCYRVFNCRTGAVILSDTTAFDISYAALPAAIL